MATGQRQSLSVYLGRVSDGRPLYAYRLSDEAYVALADSLRSDLGGRQHPLVASDTAARFCIYAAEWCRRERDGGSWSWGPLKADIALEVTDSTLRTWVQTGLGALGRDVMKSDGGSRQYLMTLACEGGLPLNRLVTKNSGLRSYFRAILAHFHNVGRTGNESPKTLTADAARVDHYLAGSFRNDVVHHLAGQLVGTVWKLREWLTDQNEDPEQTLNREVPNWRDRLPVVASDGVSLALIGGLVADVAVVAAGRTFGLSVITRVFQGPDGPSLVRQFQGPAEISHAELQEVFPGLVGDVQDQLRRVTIRMGAVDGSTAQAGVLRSENACWAYHASGSALLRGPRAAGPVSVEVFSRKTGSLHSHGVPGSGALGPLPWVFQQAADRSYTLLATGSARSPKDELLIAVRAADVVTGDITLQPELLLGRKMYKVRGVAVLQTADGVVRIRTGANQMSAYTFELKGALLSGLSAKRPIWSGVPTVVQRNQWDDGELAIEGHIVGEWRPLDDRTFGEIQVRGMRDNELVFRTKILVAPPDLIVETKRVGTRNTPGEVLFKSAHLHDIGTPKRDEFDTLVSKVSGGMQAAFQTHGRPPSRIPMTLTFATGSLTGDLVFPVQTLRFEDLDGNPLKPGTRIHLRHVGRYRAIGVTPRDRSQMSVTLSVNTKGPRPSPVTRMLRERHGVHQLELREIRQEAEHLLDFTMDLDAQVQVRLAEHGASAGARATLLIRRYDWELKPDFVNGDVSLSECIDDDRLMDVLVESRPFSDMSIAQVVPRLRSPRFDKPTWAFDVMRNQKGSHLITLRDGGWVRCRPTPMSAFGPGEEPSQGLAGAMQAKSPHIRRARLQETLLEMVTKPEHPDWTLMDGFLGLLEELPASTFDLMREVVAIPRVAAMVGLRIARLPPAQASAAWDALEQLLFLWESIPVAAWQEALQRTHARLDSIDPELALEVMKARVSIIALELPSIEYAVARWVQASGVNWEPSAEAIMSLSPEWSSDFLALRDDLLSQTRNRHQGGSDEPFPRLADDLHLTDLGRWGLKVRTPFPDMKRTFEAPTALAIAAARGTHLEPSLILYLSEVRAFDEQHFRESYLFSLGAILAFEGASS
jgi:hypothetical protein